MSEFHLAMAEEFGDVYSGVLLRDHWIVTLEGSANDALARGVKPGVVWQEICKDLDVPVARRHGRGMKEVEDS